MKSNQDPIISANEVQSIYPALDSGLNDDSAIQKMDESRMTHITAGVKGVQIQGLSTQIKSWMSSLNISRKQSMELLRMRKDEFGRESEIVRGIKSNFMTPKVAGIVEGQLQGVIVTPTTEPYRGAMPKSSESFKLNIEIPSKSDWSAPKP